MKKLFFLFTLLIPCITQTMNEANKEKLTKLATQIFFEEVEWASIEFKEPAVFICYQKPYIYFTKQIYHSDNWIENTIDPSLYTNTQDLATTIITKVEVKYIK